MDVFPRGLKKLKARIRRYEQALRREHSQFGAYDDSYGKRFLLGPLYLLAGDLPGALKSFQWFDKAFPDDSGEPYHRLCWTLALYRSDNVAAATHKLRETDLVNLYLLPRLLGLPQRKLEIWHGSSWAEKEYADDAPPEIFELWDPAALQWARQVYQRPGLTKARARYIEITAQLKSEPIGSKRSQLVEELFGLESVSSD
jgi:hypothetical protein